MKSTLSVLMIVAAGIVRANGDAVSCSVIDYLYYSSDCCDGSNSVQCMESIPQTDKAAIDNLATLKRADGAACASGDSIEYYSDGANFTGLVCAAGGPAVDCVFTQSAYGACADGSKSRTTTVTTPASGGGTACPPSPDTAVCTGVIGDSCTANAHCASVTCDSGTSKCVAAPTFTLVTDHTGWDVNSPKLMTEQECKDMATDTDLFSAFQDAWTDSTKTVVDMTFASAFNGHGACQYYPKGCSLRLGDEKLYWNDGLDGNGAACSNTLFVPTIPIPNDGAGTYFPVLNP